MSTGDCSNVTPGKPLNEQQKQRLELITQLNGGRDVVLAIDLTGSVDFSDEGKIYLRQVIENSLQPGDSVYIVPFASESKPVSNPIKFEGKQDIDKIINAIPWESDFNARNTDIQKAELSIYKGVAQLNQCRLTENTPIKPQSVVWITDAPLLTKAGISSDIWLETPQESPFRMATSPESIDRQAWLNALPINLRQREITTNNNKNYQFSVVDISPTVQEFCTPVPGSRETCIVDQYIVAQLWWPALLLGGGTILALLGAFLGIRQWRSLNTPWRLEVSFTSDDNMERQRCTLRNNQRIPLGDGGIGSIYCPGEDIRGYLERQGNQLYLRPIQQEEAPIYLGDSLVTKRIRIQGTSLRLNCPHHNRNDFRLFIRLEK